MSITKGKWGYDIRSKAGWEVEEYEIILDDGVSESIAVVLYGNEDNAKLIVDAGNVRQKINCSLPELLKQRNQLLEMTKKILFNYCCCLDYATQGSSEDKLTKEVEELINKIEKF